MPEVEHHALAPVEPAVLWDYAENIDNWARLIPGYVTHHSDGPDASDWTIKGDVGMLARQVGFHVDVVERVHLSHITFTLRGLTEPFQGRGTFRLGSADAAPIGTSIVEKRRGWLDRLLLAFWKRRRRPSAPVEPARLRSSPEARLTLELSLVAEGVMGPMVNRLIAPLLEPAATDLAAGICSAVAGSAPAGGVA